LVGTGRVAIFQICGKLSTLLSDLAPEVRYAGLLALLLEQNRSHPLQYYRRRVDGSCSRRGQILRAEVVAVTVQEDFRRCN